MTLKERQIVSAYTGVLMCKMDELQEYIEKLLNRPVQTYELANHDVWDEIKERVRPEFLELCRGVRI